MNIGKCLFTVFLLFSSSFCFTEEQALKGYCIDHLEKVGGVEEKVKNKGLFAITFTEKRSILAARMNLEMAFLTKGFAHSEPVFDLDKIKMQRGKIAPDLYIETRLKEKGANLEVHVSALADLTLEKTVAVEICALLSDAFDKEEIQ